MTAPCHRTKNPAFTNPDSASQQAINAAKKMCQHCPLIQQCAKDALTSGSDLIGNTKPADGVLQAGVICTGDYTTEMELAAVAGLGEVVQHERRRRVKAATHCVNCGAPMVRWNRHEVSAPEGFVMHYARGFCTECRSAYARAFPRGSVRGLRKPVDRKRHCAPSRKSGEVLVQLVLF